MPLIDQFNSYSDLGINIDKTHIITAQPSDDSLLATAPGIWQKVAFSPDEKYLGIRMGREVTTTDIYRAPRL